MRVKNASGRVLELPTEELINRGIYVGNSYTTLGSLEAKVETLTRMMAYFIDMSALSEQEVLELTRCDGDYTLAGKLETS